MGKLRLTLDQQLQTRTQVPPPKQTPTKFDLDAFNDGLEELLKELKSEPDSYTPQEPFTPSQKVQNQWYKAFGSFVWRLIPQVFK